MAGPNSAICFLPINYKGSLKQINWIQWLSLHIPVFPAVIWHNFLKRNSFTGYSSQFFHCLSNRLIRAVFPSLELLLILMRLELNIMDLPVVVNWLESL